MGRGRYQPDYGELFQAHLEEGIKRGGGAYEVIHFVEVYQRRDEKERREEFEQWLRSTGAFACIKCGHVFSPPSDAEEDEQVLCVLCRP